MVLVNPKHIRVVPARETDVKDSEWLADVLRRWPGPTELDSASSIRELGELTRHCKVARAAAHPGGG
jgi:hypothetical protein